MNKQFFFGFFASFLCLFLLFAPTAAVAESDGVMTLPPSTRIIEAEAFYGVEGIDTLIVPEGAEEIESLAFVGCSLTEVVLPSSLTYIASDAFDIETSMTVTAPENSYAFFRCVEIHQFLPTPSPTAQV